MGKVAKSESELTFADAKSAVERAEAGLAQARARKGQTASARAKAFDAKDDGTGTEDDYRAKVADDDAAAAEIVEWESAVERRKAALEEVIVADRKRNEALAHRTFVTLARRREEAHAGIDEAAEFIWRKAEGADKANRDIAAFVGRGNTSGGMVSSNDLSRIIRAALARVGPGPALLGGTPLPDGPQPLPGAATRPDLEYLKMLGLGGLDSRGIAAATNAALERRRFSPLAREPEPQPVKVDAEANAAGRGDAADVLPKIEPDSQEYLAFLREQGAPTLAAASIPLPPKVSMS